MRSSLWMGLVLAIGCGSRAPAPTGPTASAHDVASAGSGRGALHGGSLADAPQPATDAPTEQVALNDDPCAGGEVDGSGGGGMGLVGSGGGGGGRGEGTIGLGTIGTRGSGGGTGQGYGAGAGDKLPTGPKVQVTPGETTVTGDIDREVIRRVIRQRLNQLRYCYERQLVKEPNLEGKTVVKFVIDTNGDVPSATASGFHKDVDACVAAAFKRMKFPKPNAGVVQIVYPIVFKQDAGAGKRAPAKVPPAA